MPDARVIVHRGDGIESVHRVSAAVADPSGHLHASLGDPHLVTCLRSAAKPFQALPLVATGAADRLGLSEKEIAIACSSHNAEPRHLEVVGSLLQKAGLGVSDLRCGAHLPYDAAGASALLAAREAPTALHNNCSGKHAGMLAACVGNGWPTDAYLDPKHPLQRAILSALARYSAIPEDRIATATDGCTAPCFYLPLSAYARAFAHLARPEKAAEADREPLRRIAAAMTGGAWFVGGTGRIDTDIMGAAEGRIVSKIGGEAIQAVAEVETGRALVLKVEDGASRAGDPAVVEACRQLGWLEPRALEVLGEHWRPTLTNWNGLAIGRIEPVFELG